MTWHIVCLAGESDKFSPKLKRGGESLIVPFDVPEHPDSLQTSVPEVLARHAITLPVAAHHFLHAAIAAYTADVRVPRKGSFDGWTRDITLHLVVRSTDGWTENSVNFGRLLSFLTGDLFSYLWSERFSQTWAWRSRWSCHTAFAPKVKCSANALISR